MSAEVSRALAAVINDLQLSRPAARQLVADYGQAESVSDLPEWIRDAYSLATGAEPDGADEESGDET